MGKHASLAILVIGLIFGAACSGGTWAQEPRTGGTLVVSLQNEPTGGLNAGIYRDAALYPPAINIFNSLLRHGYDWSLLPDLAESWKISSDGREYTFQLRKDVKFHDGKPVTSADVKFSVEQILVPMHPGGRTATFPGLDAVETPDGYTVVIKFKSPNPSFIFFINAAQYFPILPKHILGGLNATEIRNHPFKDNPIGTGPFKFKQWKKGESIELVRNPDYFRKGPYLDRIVFKVIPDPAVALAALEKGEVDVIGSLQARSLLSEIPRIRNDPRFNVVTTGGGAEMGTVLCIYFNILTGPQSNVKVRQAIAHVVNRQDYINKLTFGFAKIAYSPIGSGLGEFYNPNVRKYEVDIAKANQLLDEAGYPRKADGTRFTLKGVTGIGNPEFVKAGEILREQLKQVGIVLDWRPAEAAAWFDSVWTKRDIDLTIYEFQTGPDPNAIARNYRGSNIKPVVGSNAMGYNNTRVEELFDLGLTKVDVKERAPYYREIQTIINEEVPSITIYEPPIIHIVNKDFVGVPAGPWFNLADSFENVYWTKGALVTTPTTVAVVKPTGLDTTTVAAGLVIVVIIIASIIILLRRRRAKK